MHGWKPRSGISNPRKSSALTYSSYRVVGVAQRSVSSLPYRPQQRYEHTKPTSSSQAKHRASSGPFSAEEDGQIVDLRASGHTWDAISEVLGRKNPDVWRRGQSLLKEERWVHRFETVKSNTLDEKRYRSSKPYFTTEEDAIIKEMRRTGSRFDVTARTLHRSPLAIECRW